MFSTFSGLPRTAWVLFAGTVINRLGYLVTPFLVYYLASRGVTTEQAPFVLGALGAGNLIGPMAGGLLADRVGRRPTILAGLVGTAAGQGLLFAAPGLLTLALAAVLLSAAGSMVGPAAGALLADSVESAQRRAAFSLFHWAVNIGTAVAGVLGGFLALHGYWLLFAVDVVSSLTYAAVAAVLLPGGHGAAAGTAGREAGHRRGRSGGRGSGGKGGGAGYGVVFRDPLMRALLPLFYVALVIYSLTEVALPLAVRDDGLPTTTLGLMATLNAALVVVAQPVAMTVLARFRQIPVYVAGSVLIAVGVALTGVAADTWSYAGTVILWSVGEAMIGGIAGSIVAGLAPEDARGRYQGSYQWTWGIARFTALAVGTGVYASAGPAVVWWFSGIAGVAAALALGALAPAIARRTATAEAAATAETVETASAADALAPADASTGRPGTESGREGVLEVTPEAVSAARSDTGSPV
ncbi:MFS transporter [Streptomyces sp. MST-110588]|uniref:MFS transporter n=1 Tax=Streptomyces sp. MST-110588 TaxID=2833628 RepID=UPI001F5CC8E8|nr:MFS transporter [Streptomyces sp. MST-110588]UNO38861.1 MFS transporter [Streptomyces sp. MST-110588]